jgi:hypothetical protein
VLLSSNAIAYEPSAIVWHHDRGNLEELRKQMFGYGPGLSAFLTKHLIDPRTRAKLLRRIPKGLAKIWAIPTTTRRSVTVEAVPSSELLLRELAGFLAGPFLYARARRLATMAVPRRWRDQ